MTCRKHMSEVGIEEGAGIQRTGPSSKVAERGSGRGLLALAARCSLRTILSVASFIPNLLSITAVCQMTDDIRTESKFSPACLHERFASLENSTALLDSLLLRLTHRRNACWGAALLMSFGAALEGLASTHGQSESVTAAVTAQAQV